MLNTSGSYSFKVDIFFPWLLLCTLISVITLTWWQVEALKSVESWKIMQSWSTINYLAVGLTLWTLLTLSWRIWFACRYQPYAPLSDSDLPDITIVIPAYNEGRQILHTVRSVMNSRYPIKKMQVICVDDGSQELDEDCSTRISLARKAYPPAI